MQNEIFFWSPACEFPLQWFHQCFFFFSVLSADSDRQRTMPYANGVQILRFVKRGFVYDHCKITVWKRENRFWNYRNFCKPVTIIRSPFSMAFKSCVRFYFHQCKRQHYGTCSNPAGCCSDLFIQRRSVTTIVVSNKILHRKDFGTNLKDSASQEMVLDLLGTGRMLNQVFLSDSFWTGHLTTVCWRLGAGGNAENKDFGFLESVFGPRY